MYTHTHTSFRFLNLFLEIILRACTYTHYTVYRRYTFAVIRSSRFSIPYTPRVQHSGGMEIALPGRFRVGRRTHKNRTALSADGSARPTYRSGQNDLIKISMQYNNNNISERESLLQEIRRITHHNGACD